MRLLASILIAVLATCINPLLADQDSHPNREPAAGTAIPAILREVGKRALKQGANMAIKKAAERIKESQTSDPTSDAKQPASVGELREFERQQARD